MPKPQIEPEEECDCCEADCGCGDCETCLEPAVQVKGDYKPTPPKKARKPAKKR